MEFKLILDGCSQIEDLFNQIINLYKCTVAFLYSVHTERHTHTHMLTSSRRGKHTNTWESLLKFGCLINTRLVAWHPVHHQVYFIARCVRSIIFFFHFDDKICFLLCRMIGRKVPFAVFGMGT